MVVSRVALWLMLMGAEPGQCVWDTLSERYDGIGSDDAPHSNGKDNRTISSVVISFTPSVCPCHLWLLCPNRIGQTDVQTKSKRNVDVQPPQ